MLLKCQHFNTLSVEVYFTRIGYFTWRVSDCEELVGGFACLIDNSVRRFVGFIEVFQKKINGRNLLFTTKIKSFTTKFTTKKHRMQENSLEPSGNANAAFNTVYSV